MVIYLMVLLNIGRIIEQLITSLQEEVVSRANLMNVMCIYVIAHFSKNAYVYDFLVYMMSFWRGFVQ